MNKYKPGAEPIKHRRTRYCPVCKSYLCSKPKVPADVRVAMPVRLAMRKVMRRYGSFRRYKRRVFVEAKQRLKLAQEREAMRYFKEEL